MQPFKSRLLLVYSKTRWKVGKKETIFPLWLCFQNVGILCGKDFLCFLPVIQIQHSVLKGTPSGFSELEAHLFPSTFSKRKWGGSLKELDLRFQPSRYPFLICVSTTTVLFWFLF